MAYVRTISYTFPYERIEELQRGTDLWLRLVSANKLIAQESTGMLDTGVWMTQEEDGAVRIVSYSEWYSIDDLQNFALDPDVRLHETAISKATKTGEPSVEIYQTMA